MVVGGGKGAANVDEFVVVGGGGVSFAPLIDGFETSDCDVVVLIGHAGVSIGRGNEILAILDEGKLCTPVVLHDVTLDTDKESMSLKLEENININKTV